MSLSSHLHPPIFQLHLSSKPKTIHAFNLGLRRIERTGTKLRKDKSPRRTSFYSMPKKMQTEKASSAQVRCGPQFCCLSRRSESLTVADPGTTIAPVITKDNPPRPTIRIKNPLYFSLVLFNGSDKQFAGYQKHSRQDDQAQSLHRPLVPARRLLMDPHHKIEEGPGPGSTSTATILETGPDPYTQYPSLIPMGTERPGNSFWGY